MISVHRCTTLVECRPFLQTAINGGRAARWPGGTIFNACERVRNGEAAIQQGRERKQPERRRVGLANGALLFLKCVARKGVTGRNFGSVARKGVSVRRYQSISAKTRKWL